MRSIGNSDSGVRPRRGGPKARRHTSPAQRAGCRPPLGTRANGPAHRRETMRRAFSPPCLRIVHPARWAGLVCRWAFGPLQPQDFDRPFAVRVLCTAGQSEGIGGQSEGLRPRLLKGALTALATTKGADAQPGSNSGGASATRKIPRQWQVTGWRKLPRATVERLARQGSRRAQELEKYREPCSDHDACDFAPWKRRMIYRVRPFLPDSPMRARITSAARTERDSARNSPCHSKPKNRVRSARSNRSPSNRAKRRR